MAIYLLTLQSRQKNFCPVQYVRHSTTKTVIKRPPDAKNKNKGEKKS